MSKDIHKWTDGRYTLMFDEHTFFVWDNEKEDRMTALEVTKRLNEQQATIRKLQDLCGESDSENAKLRIENEQLRKQLDFYLLDEFEWKEKYEEGTETFQIN